MMTNVLGTGMGLEAGSGMLLIFLLLVLGSVPLIRFLRS